MPRDIRNLAVRLNALRGNAEDFKKISDGYLFGFVGLDALLGFIPVVGGIYTAGGGLWLLGIAIQSKCSAGTIAMCVALSVLDIIIGIFVGFGDVADVFFRSHAWIAERIIKEIDDKLETIEDFEYQYVDGAYAPDNPQASEAAESVRDAVLRGGYTEQEMWTRMAIPLGIIALLFFSCS